VRRAEAHRRHPLPHLRPGILDVAAQRTAEFAQVQVVVRPTHRGLRHRMHLDSVSGVGTTIAATPQGSRRHRNGRAARRRATADLCLFGVSPLGGRANSIEVVRRPTFMG